MFQDITNTQMDKIESILYVPIFNRLTKGFYLLVGGIIINWGLVTLTSFGIKVIALYIASQFGTDFLETALEIVKVW
jgi:hypothetical protein